MTFKERATQRVMDAIGMDASQIRDISRIIMQMNDGSWIEFDGHQVVKISMKDRMMMTIKGNPRRAIDFSALDSMFPPRCKYLD